MLRPCEPWRRAARSAIGAIVCGVCGACGAAPATGGAPEVANVSVPEPEHVVDEPEPATEETPSAAPAVEAKCPPPPAVTEAKRPEMIRASHVLISYAGALHARPDVTRTQPEARALAEELLEKLCAGARFEDVAREYSDDPTAKKRDGDLGFFEHQSMIKSFADAAFALVPGQLSGVIETNFGYHIISRTK